jgi:hypothetical protein
MISNPLTAAKNHAVRVKVTGPFGVALQFIPMLQQFCLVSVKNEQFLFCSSHLVGSVITTARIKRHLASDEVVDATIVSSPTIVALGAGTTRTAHGLLMEAAAASDSRKREL